MVDDLVNAELGPAVGRPVHAPLSLLWAALVCLGASIVLTLVDSLWAYIVGYVLTPVATISFVSAYRLVDLRRSMNPLYSPRIDLPLIPLQGVILAVSVGVGAVHIWHLAYWLAERWP